jgi:hypothetical protein
MSIWNSNLSETKDKKEKLERYYSSNVLDGLPDYNIICQHFSHCSTSGRNNDISFYPAQLSHVGKYYSLQSNGTELRLLIAGMDYGKNDHPFGTIQSIGRVTMNEREAMLRGVAKKAFRKRNPHMKGTTIALQDVFNIGKDSEYISDNTTSINIFDAFALVNTVLCSRCENGKRESKTTGVMHNHCIYHFVNTVKILQPTLIIFQGSNLLPRFTKGLKTIGIQFSLNPINTKLKVYRITSPEIGSIVLCGLRHPARNWSSRQSRYYKDIVGPTLLEARSILGI